MYNFRVKMQQLVSSLNSLSELLHEYICSTRAALQQQFHATRDQLLLDVEAARDQLCKDYSNITARLDQVDSLGRKVQKVIIRNSSRRIN